MTDESHVPVGEAATLASAAISMPWGPTVTELAQSPVMEVGRSSTCSVAYGQRNNFACCLMRYLQGDCANLPSPRIHGQQSVSGAFIRTLKTQLNLTTSPCFTT